MTEKTFTVNEKNTNKEYKVIVSNNSETLNLKIETENEKYDSGNLSLSDLQNKNKIYKQFDNISKVADVLSSKIEKKNCALTANTCVLDIKFTNEYDEVEFVPLTLPSIGGGTSSSSTASSSDPQLKAELEKLKEENRSLKAEIEKLKGGNAKAPAASSSSAPSSFNLSDKYVPPSMMKTGNIFERIDKVLELKKDLKKTLDDIFTRLNSVKEVITKTVDKLFARNPSQADRLKVLEYIKEVLMLYQGFKEAEHYDEIFKNEVKEKKIIFNAQEQEKFNDEMAILAKSFPYNLTPLHQKLEFALKDTVKCFFIDKNLRFYKPEEIKEVNELKKKLLL